MPIPLKPIIVDIGSSRERALKRFFATERKFKSDKTCHESYINFMEDYEKQGHMIEVDNSLNNKGMIYHIPHHGII